MEIPAATMMSWLQRPSDGGFKTASTAETGTQQLPTLTPAEYEQ